MTRTEQIIAGARAAGRLVLTEVESKQIISEGGVKVVETVPASTKNQAMLLAAEMGFPVVLKTASVDAVHKSDHGGVKLNLTSRAAVGRAYKEVMAHDKGGQSHKTASTVSVQRMAPPGEEVIIGVSKDPQFGPVVMFGLGGVFVETLGDVSFRIAPLSRRDAAEMVREIKGSPVLQGTRGKPGVNILALEEMLLKLSDIAWKTPEVKEIDINPVLAYPDGVMAVDARIILEPVEN